MLATYLVVYEDGTDGSQEYFYSNAFDAENALDKFRQIYPDHTPLAIYSLVAEVEKTYKLKSV